MIIPGMHAEFLSYLRTLFSKRIATVLSGVTVFSQFFPSIFPLRSAYMKL